MILRLTEQAADQIAAIDAYLIARNPLGARNVQLALEARKSVARFAQCPQKQMTALNFAWPWLLLPKEATRPAKAQLERWLLETR